MRVVLVIPALATLGAPLAGVHTLARLAAYAGAPAIEPRGATPLLLAALGLPPDMPPAPLAARGAGMAIADGDVQYADPVTLVAGRDDVLLAGRVDDLTEADGVALVAHCNAHFAGDGLVFAAPRPDAWFVASRGVPLPTTTPLPDVAGAIAPQLPRGAHAKPWRRWISEMQMLLHEHPVNVRREAQGRAPVTGIWLWGGGPAAPSAPPLTFAIAAAAGRDGDVARGLGADASAPTRFADLAQDRDALVVLPAAREAAALPALARDWLDPLLAALERGTVRDVSLVIDDGGTAFAWHVHAPSWWRRMRVRAGGARFVLPERAR
jgi:hypothetical protein